MNHLHLRIGNEIESDGGPPPSVFGTISGLDPGSGRKRRDLTPRREPIPISINPADARLVELPPGQYLVEVTMPSGEILSNQVEMRSGEDASLVLEAEASPHEWLSWQHLVGNVSTPAVAQQLEPLGHSKSARTKAAAKAGAKRRRVKAGAREMAVSTSLPSTLFWLPNPINGLAGAPAEDPWITLGELAARDAVLPQHLNLGGRPKEIPSHDSDAERAVYRLVHGAGTTGSATALESPLPRDFVAVPQDGTIELLSLPTPWFVIPTGREAIIEIVLQLTAHVSDFAASITVRDDRLGVLLGYLSTGSLGAAREIAEDAKEMLYYKTTNPFAAAAGAYAMVATATDNADQEWHHWVENLANWFPNLPDSAILLAQLYLRLRRTKDDFERARLRLREAYRRGLPYFTLGVRWLLDGLEKVGRSDPEAEQMSRAVRAISWRLNPQSPFTILHLGPR